MVHFHAAQVHVYKSRNGAIITGNRCYGSPAEPHHARELDESAATANDDTLLDGSLGGIQGILDTELLLLELCLCLGTDLDDGNAARQAGHALVELLLLVILQMAKEPSEFTIWPQGTNGPYCAAHA